MHWHSTERIVHQRMHDMRAAVETERLLRRERPASHVPARRLAALLRRLAARIEPASERERTSAGAG